jgi:hypothetical protein
MIRRSTWVLLFILFVLIGLTLYLNHSKSTTEAGATPTSPVTYLFTSDDGLGTRIKIESQTGEVIRVSRSASGEWAIDLPNPADADQGLVEAAITQITTLRVLNTVNLAPGVIGLKPPAYTVSIGFTSGDEHTFYIGTVTPTDSGYYIQKDDGTIVIISKPGIDAMINLLTKPPYAATAAPTPEPATATPTIEPPISVSPTMTVNP